MEKRESLLKIKNYPAWLGVDTFLLAGSAVHWIIMSVMAYQLSGSLAYAGWFSTIRGITSSVTQIVGGTFIDRHNHRLLMIAQSSICCVLWTIMGLLFITGNLTFALFVALCLSSSVVFGFLGGTTNAALIRIGYDGATVAAENLTDSVLKRMYNDSVLIPAVLYLLMFVVLLFVYPLGKQKIAELQAQKEQVLSELHEA
jgi:MFS family permease